MNNVYFAGRDISMDVPEYFDELRGATDAIKIGEILLLVFTKQLDPLGGKKLAIDYFLNRKNKPNKPVAGTDAWDYWANESRLVELVDWLFVEHEIKDEEKADLLDDVVPEVRYEINPKLTSLHVPKIRMGRHVYYGPGDLLSDLTFGEVKDAMACVERFVVGADEHELDRLVGVLYSRRKRFWRLRRLFGWQGDELRLPCTGYRVGMSKNDVRKAPVGFKFWCFLFFVGCLNYIREEPVEIDGKEYNLGCMFSGGGKSSDDTGLTGVMFSMAESGVFGTLEETGNASYYDVALRLYQVHRQSQDMKSKTK